jgi:uncharacterized damage-inducible protein DinB
MTTTILDPIRYPIGKAQIDPTLTEERRAALIEQLAAAPEQVRAAVAGLDDAQLDTPYREGGWTVRQVVHHLADAHLNAFARFKLGLTEEAPAVKTFDENLWADTEDARRAPVELSLTLLAGLHGRWAALLRSLKAADFDRTIQHPERGELSLAQLLQIYSWHGPHHVAHITALRERMGW